MRQLLVVGAAVLCAIGCSPADTATSGGGSGGTSDGGTPDGGGGSDGGGTATARLTLHVAGSGDVRSSNPAFDCHAECTQDLAQGTRVTLVAVPGAGSGFMGWSGACAGTGDCTVTLDANRDVAARFVPLPPPPPGQARVSVQFTGSGSGRVTSNTGGLGCPGTCSVTVASGTPMTLTATADGNSTFVGWGGACGGSGPCNLSANGDQTVWVNFQANPPPPPPPPVNSCEGIAKPDSPAMMQYVRPTASYPQSCGNGVGDSTGTLAFTINGPDVTFMPFVTTKGQLLSVPGRDSTSGFGALALMQPKGTAVLDGAPYRPSGGNGQLVDDFDSGGKHSGTRWLYNYTRGVRLPAAADPNGGVLFAGDLGMGPSDAPVHAAVMVEGGSTDASVRWGPKALASSGTVFGLGVDVLGRSIVITDGGAKFGGGSISAQWFDKDGTALTDQFALYDHFSAGPSTWFEVNALIGGGVLVRRMDGEGGGGTHLQLHSQALVTVDSGTATVHTALAWMTSRRDVRLQIARGGKAYAVLPLQATNVTCSQRVEVVAPDGTSCGATDYPIAAGNCDTEEVSLGLDGTLIQKLPAAMERAPDAEHHSCTWRWWPGAAR